MLGPVEVIVIGFKGNQFKGEIIAALREVVERGLIRIIDLVFIKKDNRGAVEVTELKEIDAKLAGEFNQLVSEISGLISDEDITKLAVEMENNTSGGIMVFEHAWAKNFQEAVIRAKGKLIADFNIPHSVVEMAEEAAKTPVKV